MDESKIIRQMQRGDTAALEQAIRHYSPYVSAAAYRVLGPSMPKEDLEEVVSDAFVSLWRHAATLEPDRGTLRAWLGVTAANAAKDKLRAYSPALPLGEEVAAEQSPADEVERSDRSRLLWRAVEELGEPDATLFFRYYYEGEKLKDVARELGMNLSTVKTRLARGRRLLEDKLREMGGMEA